MSVMFLFLIIAVVLVIIIPVCIILAMASSRRSCGVEAAAPVAPVSPLPLSEERQTVLQELAKGEITKAQAEERLSRIGTPVPAGIAPPVLKPAGGRGCLIALLIAVVLIPLMLMIAIYGYFSVRDAQVQRERACLKQHAAMEEFQRAHMSGQPEPVIPASVRNAAENYYKNKREVNK